MILVIDISSEGSVVVVVMVNHVETSVLTAARNSQACRGFLHRSSRLAFFSRILDLIDSIAGQLWIKCCMLSSKRLHLRQVYAAFPILCL